VPYDEVDYNTYNRMVKAFQELIPELSSKLEESRTDERHVRIFKQELKIDLGNSYLEP
jgi:hypothetical protein